VDIFYYFYSVSITSVIPPPSEGDDPKKLLVKPCLESPIVKTMEVCRERHRTKKRMTSGKVAYLGGGDLEDQAWRPAQAKVY
jgi:hypothetical protein